MTKPLLKTVPDIEINLVLRQNPDNKVNLKNSMNILYFDSLT